MTCEPTGGCEHAGAAPRLTGAWAVALARLLLTVRTPTGTTPRGNEPTEPVYGEIGTGLLAPKA